MPEINGLTLEPGDVFSIVYKTAASDTMLRAPVPCTITSRVVVFLGVRQNRFVPTWNMYSLTKRVLLISFADTPEMADYYTTEVAMSHSENTLVWRKPTDEQVQAIMQRDNGVGFRQFRPERIMRIRPATEYETAQARIALTGINIQL